MTTSLQRYRPARHLTWSLVLVVNVAVGQPLPIAAPQRILTNLNYTSPIGAYQAYVDQPVQSWREANDLVGRIGGWRAYAREMPEKNPDQGKSAASDPHAGHHGGGKP